MRIVIILCFLFSGGVLADEKSKLALAYAERDYNQVAKLLKSVPESKEKRLIGALGDLYDRSRQNIGRGQQVCAEIFADEEVELKYRMEAGIALARTAQLMKERRDVYGKKADDYDHVEIYRKVMELKPDSASSCGRARKSAGI